MKNLVSLKDFWYQLAHISVHTLIGKPDPAYLNEGVFLLYAIQALEVYKNLHRRINELIPLTKIGSKILINLFDRDGFCFLNFSF